MFIGPMKDGTYFEAVVRSIHVSQMDVDHTYAGHLACFALGSLPKSRRSSVTKGMVALTKVPNPPVIRTFQAEIVMLRGEPVTVTKGRFNATAHILHIKRAVKVVDIEPMSSAGRILGQMRDSATLVLRPGDQARVQFKVVNGPAVSSTYFGCTVCH